MPAYLHLEKEPFWLKDISIYHSMVGFYVKGKLSDKAKMNLETIWSREELKRRFTTVWWDWLGYDPSEQYVKKYTSMSVVRKGLKSTRFWTELKKDFFEVALWENFPLYCSLRLEMMQILLRNYEWTRFKFYSKQHTCFKQFFDSIRTVSGILEQYGFGIFIWGNLRIPFILFVLSSLISIKMKNPVFLIFSSMILIQFFVLYFISPSSDWRYLYCLYFGSFYIYPIYTSLRETRKN